MCERGSNVTWERHPLVMERERGSLSTKLLNVLQRSDLKKCMTRVRENFLTCNWNCQPVSKFMPKCGLIMLHKDLLKMKEGEREREKWESEREKGESEWKSFCFRFLQKSELVLIWERIQGCNFKIWLFHFFYRLRKKLQKMKAVEFLFAERSSKF